MGALDDFNEEVGECTLTTDERGSLVVSKDRYDLVLAAARKYLGVMDSLADNLTEQIITLRAAESQWLHGTDDEPLARPMFGMAGAMPQHLEDELLRKAKEAVETWDED